MKGIILAGGSGTRLYPITNVVSKQLMPVYDKPMIYYPISVLLLGGIRDILIISSDRDNKLFQDLLGDGSDLGVKFSYEIQREPNGLAEALIIGENFLRGDNCCLILGDNLFYGDSIGTIVKNAANICEKEQKAVIFGYRVSDPERYGVVELDRENNIVSIEEKPKIPKSLYAVCGLYFFPKDATKTAKTINKSDRGELEITDVIAIYAARKKARAELFGRGFAWLDTGTHDSLLEASAFVSAIERRQGLKIACLEEIAFLMGYIDLPALEKLAKKYIKSGYGEYLLKFAREERCE